MSDQIERWADLIRHWRHGGELSSVDIVQRIVSEYDAALRLRLATAETAAAEATKEAKRYEALLHDVTVERNEGFDVRDLLLAAVRIQRDEARAERDTALSSLASSSAALAEAMVVVEAAGVWADAVRDLLGGEDGNATVTGVDTDLVAAVDAFRSRTKETTKP